MIITRFRSLDLKSFVYFACSPNANEALLWLGRVFKGGDVAASSFLCKPFCRSDLSGKGMFHGFVLF